MAPSTHSAMTTANTFPALIAEHARVRGQRPAIREKHLGIWQTLTWQQVHDRVRILAHGLAALGVERGQHVAVIGENRPQLYLSMMAAQTLGAIPIALYQDAVAQEMVYVLQDADVGVVIVRASDVPTYVQYGAADIGIAGKDVLIEHGGAGLYQPLDLNIARCRMCVAAPVGFDYAAAVKRGARLRIATKYLHTAREHFAAKGVHVDLIKLYGSMELAPLVGLADAIVDLVSSGATLKANNLAEVEEIMSISSRLIVNQAALKVKHETLQSIIDAFKNAIK